MRYSASFSCAALTAFVILASAGPALSQSQAGLAVVQQHCAMCHAVGTTGGSPHSSAPPLRKLGNSYDLDKLQEILESGTILPSHPDMPRFKLDRNTARAVVNYLRTIQE